MESEGRRPSRGKKDVDGFIAWTSNEHALVVKVEHHLRCRGHNLKVPEGEIVVMSRKTITEIFELVSEAP